MVAPVDAQPDEVSDALVMDSWQGVRERLTELGESVESAVLAFDVDGAADKVSAITRKRLAVKAVERLQSASGLISTIASGLQHLEAHAAQCDTQLEEQQRHRTLAEERLHKAKDENEQLIVRMSELEQAVTSYDIKVHDLTRKSKIDEELRHTLEGQVEKLSEDVLELQQRARDAEASQQEMAEEHEHAMHDMQLATSEGRKACEELADAQASASKAGADCVRAQQAMAKLSADNVVLMVKLQKAEARCKALGGECAELRAAVETRSGPWFDEVRAVVQHRIQEGMEEARALQAQLGEAKQQHATDLARVTEAKEQLSAHLSSTLASCQQLEDELQQSQKAGKLLRVELKEQGGALAQALAARDEARASVRVATEERQQMKGEWADMFAAHDGLRSRIAELTEQAAGAEAALQDAQRQAQALEQRVDVERAVNRDLLQRKSETEYQLMAALARLPGVAPGPVPARALGGSVLSAPAQDPSANEGGVFERDIQQRSGAGRAHQPSWTGRQAPEAIAAGARCSALGSQPAADEATEDALSAPLRRGEDGAERRADSWGHGGACMTLTLGSCPAGLEPDATVMSSLAPALSSPGSLQRTQAREARSQSQCSPDSSAQHAQGPTGPRGGRSGGHAGLEPASPASTAGSGVVSAVVACALDFDGESAATQGGDVVISTHVVTAQSDIVLERQ